MSKIPDLTDRPRWIDNGRVNAFSQAMSAARAVVSLADHIAADGPPSGHREWTELLGAARNAIAEVASPDAADAWTTYAWTLEDLLVAAAGDDARLHEAVRTAAKDAEVTFIAAARRALTS
jgi:hypothetical protein